MDHEQEQRDKIRRKIGELQTELTRIDLEAGGWNTEREDQIQKEIQVLRSELDKLGHTNRRE
jgi:phage host-nuclease inhibitor protein Gam